MIIEVTGTSTRNKGAELLLVAIQQHLATCSAETALAVDSSFGTYAERARYGLLTKLATKRLGRSAIAMALVPLSFRNNYGLVVEKDVDVILDASGFAFSDQLGADRIEEFARDVRRWKRQGKPVVLLPQAMGPFGTSRTRRAMTDILECADLIYARDRVSHEHLLSINQNIAKIRLAPDFTNLVSGKLPHNFQKTPKSVCIVPNHRMVEMTEQQLAKQYVPFLAACIRELLRCEFDPFILLHDTCVDEKLVAPLQSALDSPIQVWHETDPVKLKGILGNVDLVVGSRFHALVGALSQAVPCIGAGWSHKYEMLFEDYNCKDLLLPVDTPVEKIRETVREVIGGAERKRLLESLNRSAHAQKQRAEEMWAEVDSVLRLGSQCSTGSDQRYGAESCITTNDHSNKLDK